MLNKIMLIGNLGADPEHSAGQNGGNSRTNFRIATSEKWKDHSGEWKEETQWHRVVTWGKLADICNQHLKKGRKVYVEGKIKHRTFENDQGETKYITEVSARDVTFLDSRGDGDSQGAPQSGGYSQPQQPAYRPPPQAPTSAPPAGPPEDDSDIPF